jgi:hypothetical protein
VPYRWRLNLILLWKCDHRFACWSLYLYIFLFIFFFYQYIIYYLFIIVIIICCVRVNVYALMIWSRLNFTENNAAQAMCRANLIFFLFTSTVPRRLTVAFHQSLYQFSVLARGENLLLFFFFSSRVCVTLEKQHVETALKLS